MRWRVSSEIHSKAPLLTRPAIGADVEAMTETLCRAFAEDPVWGGWAFPDRLRAPELRRAFFDFWVRAVLRYGGVRVTPKCEAVAAWYPPGTSQNSEEDERRLAAMARELLGEHAGVFLKGCEIIETTHPHARPHWYLSFLATHPDHRGQGLGVALLEECLARIDAEELPGYLESTYPANNRLYERLGFARVGEFILPSGGPTVGRYWREPRSGAITRP